MDKKFENSRKFVFLILLTCLICFPSRTTGYKCYECVETEDATRDLKDSNACVNVIPSGRTTNCLSTVSAPYCLKIKGVRDGEQVGVRVCATDDWKILMRSTDKCMSAEELNRRGRTKIKIDHGMICICDSDRCNGGFVRRSGLPFIFAITLTTILANFL